MKRHEEKTTMPSVCGREAAALRLALLIFLPSIAQGQLEWVNEPYNRAVVLGDDLVLPCQARLANQSDSSTVLTYLWQLNGGNLTSKASRFFNNSLFVPKISEADLGDYSCQVTALHPGSGNLVKEVLSATALVIEAFIDPFVIQPLSQEATIGDEVTLTCVTGRSAPDIQVYWLRDGKVFTQGDSLTASYGGYDTTGLTTQLSMKLMFKVSADSFGAYECVAANSVLKKEVLSLQANVTNKIVLSSDLPVIEWNLPERLVVIEGQNLILHCQTTESTEPVSTGWYIGRYRVDESRRVYMMPNSSLGFFPVATRDSGNYSCVAENSKGFTQSPFLDLEVAFLGLEFQTNPSDKFAIYGENVILECDPPDSIPTATVTWYKDYSILDLRPDHVRVVDNDLHLTSVGKADKGLYYCVAVNNFTIPSSRTSKPAMLTLEGPPVMTQPPTSTTVIKGKLLHLTCMVDCDPLPTTSWQFEGRALPDNSKLTLVNQGQELWITDVGKEWEGRFTCLSSNKYGHISAEAFVTIIVPPVPLQPIGEVVVKSGESVVIPCPVVSDPKPSISWFFNGKNISVKTSEIFDTSHLNWTLKSSDLFVEHVTPQYAGNYTCVGSNQGGNASSSGTLVVQVLPSFSQSPGNTTAVIGSSVTLKCQTEGLPIPSLHWLFNSSTQLPKDSHLGDINETLTIPAVGWDNIGTYTCLAQNVVGSVKAAAHVMLMIPPKVEDLKAPGAPIRIQTTVTLSCTASGLPPPSIQWTHQGHLITASLDGRIRLPDKGVLVIQFAQQSDSGLYECVANSSVGQDSKTVSLVVYGPPSPPVLQSAVPISAESVYLLWEWSDKRNNSERMDKFQIFYRTKTSEETEIYPEDIPKNITRTEVTGLQPGTEYVFYMTAVNDVGSSQSSNVMSAVTLQSGPSAPVNFQVTSISQTSVTLTWEVPTFRNGVVRMYQLRYKRISEFQQDFMYVNITKPQFPTHEISLSPLRPYTQYNAQVRAGNIDTMQYLWGNYTPVLTFHTLTAKPSLPPQFVEMTAVDPYSLEVTWQSIPLLAQNGPILFYHIVYTDNESQLLGNDKVNSSVMTFTFRGLSPWRYYSVTIRGENAAGLGPVSEPIRARTLPVAPIAAPGDFQVTADSSSGLKLTWKALPFDLMTCEITDYVIEYRLRGNISWHNVTVPSNATDSSFSFVLESLQPWTWYECRIAAFTDAFTPGLGPFSDAVLTRTLQGESSPVTALSYVANSTSISLSWQPPKDIKGILIGYRVSFQPLDIANTSEATEDLNIITSTSVILQDLTPSTVYNIRVGAVNGAGLGKEVVVRVRTLPSLQTPPTPTVILLNLTTGSNNVSSLQQSDNSHITKNLASIVAGSIVGGIALIIITVFICVKCMRYRQKQRLKYEYHAYFNQGYTTQMM